jgi:hypothetical protein
MMPYVTDDVPQTDGRDPAAVVTAATDHVLELAESWIRWDGHPVQVPVDEEPEPRLYTPHKVIRRVTDHMIDHLAEVQARLAGRPTQPDRWHASAITTAADLAAFTEADLDEATSRLLRLDQLWEVTLRSLTSEQLDAGIGEGWTFRQVAFHVGEVSAIYAGTIGPIPR